MFECNIHVVQVMFAHPKCAIRKPRRLILKLLARDGQGNISSRFRLRLLPYSLSLTSLSYSFFTIPTTYAYSTVVVILRQGRKKTPTSIAATFAKTAQQDSAEKRKIQNVITKLLRSCA
jgi:hypothetical protein